MEEYGNFKSNGFWKIVSGACWLSGFYLFAEFCFSVGGGVGYQIPNPLPFLLEDLLGCEAWWSWPHLLLCSGRELVFPCSCPLGS